MSCWLEAPQPNAWTNSSHKTTQKFPSTCALWLGWLPRNKAAPGSPWVFSRGDGCQCVHLTPGSASMTFPLPVPCPPVLKGLGDTTALESTFLQGSVSRCFPLCGAASPLCSWVSRSSLNLNPSHSFHQRLYPSWGFRVNLGLEIYLTSSFLGDGVAYLGCSLKALLRLPETGMAHLECSRKEHWTLRSWYIF